MFFNCVSNGGVNFQDYIAWVKWYWQGRETCPIVTLSITNPTRTGLGFNPGLCDEGMAANHLWPYVLYWISLCIMHVCLECRLFFGCNVDAVLEEALSEISPKVCTGGDLLCCLTLRMILPNARNYTLTQHHIPKHFQHMSWLEIVGAAS